MHAATCIIDNMYLENASFHLQEQKECTQQCALNALYWEITKKSLFLETISSSSTASHGCDKDRGLRLAQAQTQITRQELSAL